MNWNATFGAQVVYAAVDLQLHSTPSGPPSGPPSAPPGEAGWSQPIVEKVRFRSTAVDPHPTAHQRVQKGFNSSLNSDP